MSRTAGMVLCALLAVALSRGAAIAEDFSADMVSRAQGRSFQGRIFCAKDKARMELPEGVTITRMDKKTVWILMPREKRYLEQAFDASQNVAAPGQSGGEVERSPAGRETVDGKQADKFKVVLRAGNRTETVYQWFIPGLSIPVKTAATDGSWSLEYRNVRPGKQEDALFEIPWGYEKFSMNMPSMKDVQDALQGMGQ